MNVRTATVEDAPAIRQIAQASMRASYSLSPGTIEGAVDEWYDDDALADRLDDEAELFLVAEDDEDGIVAFSESLFVDDRGDILWIHVDPIYRGSGVGSELFDATRAGLIDRGASFVRGLVLADNAVGNDFYEREGFTKAGERTVDIDGDDYIENIYVDQEPAEMTVEDETGRQLYVDRADSDRGSLGEFHVVFSDPDHTEKYGFHCGNCGALVTAMDSMGRMECDSCGNRRKPTRWDAAYM
jgi:ribosomal protein S18 acetylase RimI-like enzyme